MGTSAPKTYRNPVRKTYDNHDGMESNTPTAVIDPDSFDPEADVSVTCTCGAECEYKHAWNLYMCPMCENRYTLKVIPKALPRVRREERYVG